jgi:hypothetical protein
MPDVLVNEVSQMPLPQHDGAGKEMTSERRMIRLGKAQATSCQQIGLKGMLWLRIRTFE